MLAHALIDGARRIAYFDEPFEFWIVWFRVAVDDGCRIRFLGEEVLSAHHSSRPISPIFDLINFQSL